MTVEDMQSFLRSTPTIDYDHPKVADFARRNAAGAASDVERAVKLFYAVRDGIRYDPYRIDLSVEGLKASTTLEHGYGWCVSKAILLSASLRGVGIPARLGFADVRNHLSTARMRELMQTDLFCWHGYASIFLEGRWIKATPAFNVELCTKSGLLPLEFDGHHDSLYHPFDREGKQHMEYVRQRGEFDDVPIQAIIQTFLETYPIARRLQQDADFEHDVDRET
jgi:transglutaminase-like putative cysteine protease